MNGTKVVRPEGQKGKINCKEHFELCYLRHKYLRRAEYNPSEEQMAPYFTIVKQMTGHTFSTYGNLFKIIGFEFEDLLSISKIHLVSFLGLFSMESMPDKYTDFIKKFKEIKDKRPSKNDTLNKNKANFTLFLKQRMEDIVRICRQKARNIKGFPTEEFYTYAGRANPPKVLRDLVEDYSKFGYRKLDQAVFRGIRKKAKTKERSFKFQDIWYISISIERKNLNILDFSGADMDPYDNIHNMNPEQIFFYNADEEQFTLDSDKFHNSSRKTKMRILKSFIDKNKKNPSYKSELKTAHRMLENWTK